MAMTTIRSSSRSHFFLGKVIFVAGVWILATWLMLPWPKQNLDANNDVYSVLLSSPVWRNENNILRDSHKIKTKRHKRPCAYYANSTATFQLLLVGDLVFKLNPGPAQDKRTNSIVSPCEATNHKTSYLACNPSNHTCVNWPPSNLNNCLSLLADRFVRCNQHQFVIPTRVTSRSVENSVNHQVRNLNNLINIKTDKLPSKCMPRIRLATWNAHSINKKAASICDLVISKRIDIFTLTETWLTEKNCNETTLAEILNTLQDYQFHHLPRCTGKGGGVGVFLRKGFDVKENDVSSFSSLEYIDLSVTYNSTLIRLITIYRPPPSKKNKLTPSLFLEEFSTLLEHLAVVPGHLIITGDFNFHMELANNSDAVNFSELLDSAGLAQRVDGPTHNRGHTLDLIIDREDESLLCGRVEIISDVPSDHSAVICSIDLPRPNPSRMTIRRRDLRRMDLQSWRDDIFNSNLHASTPGSSTGTDALADQYNNTLRELIDKHAPEKSRSVVLRPNAPWFTDDLRLLKRQKRQYERKYLSTGLEVHRQVYKDKCRAYTVALDSVKSDYYKVQISNSDQKKLFHMIEGLFKVKPVPPLPSHTSLSALADDFNEYFCSKIQKLRDGLLDSGLSNMDLSVSVNQSSCQSSFSNFATVSESYIRELVEKSKPKSCSLDPIPTNVLKQSVDALVVPLTNIVNTSLTTGVFPASLKKGIVRPSIKKRTLDRDIFSSYRPITNVAYLSKTLERVAVVQMMNYLLANNLLAKLQSAYRCYHSTETALVRVFNDIFCAIDQKKEVVLVLLDLSSAFDTIDHSVLLDRLRNRYGMNGAVLQWFQSYLIGRTQSVMVKDTQSSERPLCFGVPQGSVLGPILFSLFFAPLEDVISAHGLDCMMYADDTQLYVSFNSPNRMAQLSKLESCTNDIMIWCTNNGLICNADKTEVIHLSSRYGRACDLITELNIGGTVIAPTQAARNLGVTLDSKLTLTKHVNSICKSASFAIKNIGKIRKYLTQADCERLIHAFVTSKLDSCNSILYGLPVMELNKLQRILNTAARLVTRSKKSENITPILRKLHWLPIKSRIIFKLLLLTFKALHGQAPNYITELLHQYKPSRNLRSINRNLLVLPKSYTKTYGDKSFSVAAAKLWNALPDHIRQIDSINIFKLSIKTYLFNIH